MAVEWTKEQRQVIELRNRNILVSAAAGSGKTAVLVERIIQRITDEQHPVDVDRLLGSPVDSVFPVAKSVLVSAL